MLKVNSVIYVIKKLTTVLLVLYQRTTIWLAIYDYFMYEIYLALLRYITK